MAGRLFMVSRKKKGKEEESPASGQKKSGRIENALAYKSQKWLPVQDSNLD